MLKSEIERIVDEKIESAKKSALTDIKNKYETMIKKDISSVFDTGDRRVILGYIYQLEQIHKYAKSKGLVEEKPTFKEARERWKEQEEKLHKILLNYSYGQEISKEELMEKTGLNGRQIYGYTRGKKPFLEKVDSKHYKLVRVLKKEVVNEKFIGENTGVVHDKYDDYLEEKKGLDDKQ